MSFADIAKSMNLKEGDDLFVNAQQIWSMLDDMAATNPEGYKAFIEKQKKEQEDLTKQSKPPIPVFSISTFDVLTSKPVIVNMCESLKVPAPKTATDAIPVVVRTPPQDIVVHGKSSSAYDVVFHPDILQRCSSDALFKTKLIELAFDCLRQQKTHGVSCSKSYTIEKPVETVAPPPPSPAKPSAPVPVDIPSHMERFLINDSNARSNTAAGPAQPTTQASHLAPVESSNFEVSLNVIERILTATVYLPSVSSVSELELDTLATKIVVNVPTCGQSMTIPLQKTIDPETVKAKFIKKKNQLVVTASYAS